MCGCAASVLSFQCCPFRASLDFWAVGGIDKEGRIPCPHWISRWETRKDRFVYLYGSRHVHEDCCILLHQSDFSQNPRLSSWVEDSANSAKAVGLIPVQAIQSIAVLSNPFGFLLTQNIL